MSLPLNDQALRNAAVSLSAVLAGTDATFQLYEPIGSLSLLCTGAGDCHVFLATGTVSAAITMNTLTEPDVLTLGMGGAGGTLTFPTSITGGIEITNSAAPVIVLPNTGLAKALTNLTKITTLNAKAVGEGYSFVLIGAPLLEDLTFPSNFGGNINVESAPLLSSLDIQEGALALANSVYFVGCALDAESMDALLSALAGSAINSGTLHIVGGTSVAPVLDLPGNPYSVKIVCPDPATMNADPSPANWIDMGDGHIYYFRINGMGMPPGLVPYEHAIELTTGADNDESVANYLAYNIGVNSAALFSATTMANEVWITSLANANYNTPTQDAGNKFTFYDEVAGNTDLNSHINTLVNVKSWTVETPS